MGISREEAAARLNKGDIGFILQAEPSRLKELARLDPAAPFYAALLTESYGDRIRAACLYETALDCASARIRLEAAAKLADQMLDTRDRVLALRILALVKKMQPAASKQAASSQVVPAPDAAAGILESTALYVLGSFDDLAVLYRERPRETDRDRAFSLLAHGVQNAVRGGVWSEETAGELRDFFFRGPVNDMTRWTGEELLGIQGLTLPPAEAAAMAGRFAAAKSGYHEALEQFETAFASSQIMFFRYPDLLGDLGRSYQGIPARREAGLKLFAVWGNDILAGSRNITGNLSAAEQRTARYYLLFYSGRIRRSQGKNADAAELFRQALDLIPGSTLDRDERQKDACIWYLLDSSLSNKPQDMPALIRDYAPHWNRDSSFSDILDRLCSYLVGAKKWTDMNTVLSVIRNGSDGAAAAQYAYLLGRAVEEGYVTIRGITAKDYFNLAYEEGNASFYYRGLAASRLGKTITAPAPQETGGEGGGKWYLPNGTALEFYAKFFDYGAAAFAWDYLRGELGSFTTAELRSLSALFSASALHRESIMIAGSYMRREEYVMEAADLKLYYPQPFKDLIEKNAVTAGVMAPVFYGLIRTESAFVPDIVSRAGAVGLAQLMPSTGREMANQLARRGDPHFTAGTPPNLRDPETNAYLGASYLKQLTDSLQSPMLALLAYNGGPTRIRRLRRESPSLPEDLFLETITVTETREYGKRVMAAAAAYGYLYYGMSIEAVVADIFI